MKLVIKTCNKNSSQIREIKNHLLKMTLNIKIKLRHVEFKNVPFNAQQRPFIQAIYSQETCFNLF